MAKFFNLDLAQLGFAYPTQTNEVSNILPCILSLNN